MTESPTGYSITCGRFVAWMPTQREAFATLEYLRWKAGLGPPPTNPHLPRVVEYAELVKI